MAYSDELSRKAKNMSPGWARGYLKAAAQIERGKEFKKASGLNNPSNAFLPPLRKSNNSSSGAYSGNQFRQANTLPSGYVNPRYRRSFGSRIAGAIKFLFKLIFWFVMVVVALAFFVNYMGSHH